MYNTPFLRGVEIMETDAQGRGLEEYARDSWRMSEQEKTEIVDIITLERRTRIRETCRIQVRIEPGSEKPAGYRLE